MATQTAERPITQANEAALQALPFADAQDFEDARRGFLGTIDPMRIENADGRVVWEMDSYAFVDGDPPPTVHPSLWRQAQLLAIHGSVSHNVKAIYQRYMGWFDGNPAHLWEHPPVEAAKRYVDFMGGSEAILERARSSFDDGDCRWVAQVVNHVVFADPDNADARELQAAALEQLGYGAENGIWRNFFLNGATELREGNLGTPTSTASADMIANLTLEQIFDSLAIRIDGPRAAGEQIALNWTVDGQRYVTTLVNGVLTYLADKHDDDAVASLTVAHGSLIKLVAGLASPDDLVAAGELSAEGDGSSLTALLELLDAPDPNFAIVTP